MKFSTAAGLVTTILRWKNLTVASSQPSCTPIAPGPYLTDIGIKAKHVATIPAPNTASDSYNMAVVEGFSDRLMFIDQKEGRLFSYDPVTKVQRKIFDVASDTLPAGMDVTYVGPPFSPAVFKIHQVAPALEAGYIIVMFTSVTLPTGVNADSFPKLVNGTEFPDAPYDVYRTPVVEGWSQGGAIMGPTAYKLFYKFAFNPAPATNQPYLTNPKFFFAYEQQITIGHQGGGMVVVPARNSAGVSYGANAGKVLVATGDCLTLGWNGLVGAQDTTNHCAKMLRLDPNDVDRHNMTSAAGVYDVVAKGIRNSQQMNVEGDNLVFMDIGGVTAEEVNVVPLANLLDTTTPPVNFGWGERRNETITDAAGQEVPFSREGTFAVGRGVGLTWGTPPCLKDLTGTQQTGFVKPYIQFGRSPGVPLWAISSSVMSNQKSFKSIKLLFTEFNTANMIVTREDYSIAAGPRPVNYVRTYNETANGHLVPLEHGLHSFVIEMLNLNVEDMMVNSRGDPRLFKFPDGKAGAFIERTGQVFELEEFDVAATDNAAKCETIGPGTIADLSVKVKYEDRVPVLPANTADNSYNMAVVEGFADKLVFIDQKEGIIYMKRTDLPGAQVVKIYDIKQDTLPTGINVNIVPPSGNPYSNGIFKIHSVSPGPDATSMYVVFTSSTVPSQYTAASGMNIIMPRMPREPEYDLYNWELNNGSTQCSAVQGNGNSAAYNNLCNTRGGNVFGAPFCCTGAPIIYKTFFKFTFNPAPTGTARHLTSPEIVFALPQQYTYGHQGGGMVTVPSGAMAGDILYAVGDCLPLGLNGLYGSQSLGSHCAKMLLISSRTYGSYSIAAQGIRNSQQMNIEGDNLVFMDIGGVTAEEVNSVPLADILDSAVVENFGWGMRDRASFGREGTFAVARGEKLAWGNPPCLTKLTEEQQVGFIKPYMQFGRQPGVFLLAITSSVMSSVSFKTIKLAATEFNTGTLIVAREDYNSSQPSKANFVQIYKEDAKGNLSFLKKGFNSFVVEDLSLLPEQSARGDARLFKYPDGRAGVFIERTGQFFQIEEASSHQCPTPIFDNLPPVVSKLQNWGAGNYDATNGLVLPSSKIFADYGYMYNSPMVLPVSASKKLFRADYKLTNSRTSYPRDGTSPGVPGAYLYTEGYEHWGGDNVTLGKQRYSSMIGHLGHSHILSVIAKINLLRIAPCIPTPSQNKMLDHLSAGSKQILAWFAGLVDSNGNPITNPSKHPISQQLFGLMSMLIYGDGSPNNNNGIVDTAALFNAIQGFIDLAKIQGFSNIVMLEAESARLKAFLTDVLDLTGSNPIPLISWNQLIDMDQLIVDSYIRYEEAWRTNPTHPDYAAVAKRALDEQLTLIRTGPQKAAFFGLFYSFTNFLDKFYAASLDEDYSIPTSIMDKNVNYVHSELKWRLMERKVMFNDYAKAAALDDEDAMYKVQLNLLDSGTTLATALGEVFYRFDRLMRGREVFKFIDTIRLETTFEVFVPGKLTFSNTTIEGLTQAQRTSFWNILQNKISDKVCPGLDVKSCSSNVLRYNGNKVNNSKAPSSRRKLLRNLQTENLEVEFEINLVGYCGAEDCSDASSVANTLSSESSRDLQAAITDGTLVTTMRNASSDFDTLLAGAVASGELSEAVVPVLETLIWYPDWGTASHTCKNDGEAPMYMVLTGLYFETSVQKCCERFFSWDLVGCAGSAANVPTGFYPNWGNPDSKCLNSTETMPDYMQKNPTQWLFPDIESCCTKYYNWDHGKCVVGSGGNPSESATMKWFVVEEDKLCRQDCPEDSGVTCGGSAERWDTLFDTAEKCCEGKLSWLPSAVCEAQSKSSPVIGSNLWHVDWVLEKCVKDCVKTSSDANCGGLADNWEGLFGSESECCARLDWVPRSECTA